MGFEDRFTQDHPLGESPHGAVWAGQDTKFRKPVAITRLSADADPEVRARFVALVEGGIESLRVMTVARVIDAGLDADAQPYLVTELQDGAVSLQDHFAEGPPVTVATATRCIVDLLGALTKLEKLGLVHGDIEPGNVLLIERSKRLSPRLIGFGLNRAAMRTGAAPLDSSDYLASLAYMAPEQAEGRDEASGDRFSTAALLYAWITGQPPIPGSSAEQIRAAASTRAVTPLGERVPELAGSVLAKVLDQALRRDPAERFENAATLTAKLRASILQSPAARDLEVPVGAREPAAADVGAASTSQASPSAGPETKKMAAIEAKALANDSKLPPNEDELEFEGVSGLLMVPDDGPPKRVAALPPAAKKAAPPPPAKKAAPLPPAKKAAPLPPAKKAEAKPAPASRASDRPSDGLDELLTGLEEDVDLPPPAALPEADLPSGPTDLAAMLEPDDPDEEGVESKAAHEAPDPPEGDASEGDASEGDASEADAASEGDASEASEGEASEGEASEGAASEASESAVAEEPASDPEPSSDARDRESLPSVAAVAAAPSAMGEDRVEDYELPQGKSSWPLIGGGVALAAVAAVVIAFVAMGGEEPATAEPEPTPPVASEPPEPEVAVAVEEPEVLEAQPEEEAEPELEARPVQLIGVPDGATVLVDGEPIEGTTLSVGAEPLSVEVQAEGFEPWQATLDAESAAELTVELAALEAEDEDAEEDADEGEEPERQLTPAQRRRLARNRARRRARRREARRRRQNGAGGHPMVGPNPY